MKRWRPNCWSECSAVLRDGMAEQGVEVHVSTQRPLVRSRYATDPFVCPHGQRYWIEPTSEQIAQWVQDKVR